MHSIMQNRKMPKVSSKKLVNWDSLGFREGTITIKSLHKLGSCRLQIKRRLSPRPNVHWLQMCQSCKAPDTEKICQRNTIGVQCTKDIGRSIPRANKVALLHLRVLELFCDGVEFKGYKKVHVKANLKVKENFQVA